jgi:DNA-directed RNA polymerase specialized sigma24 family protein
MLNQDILNVVHKHCFNYYNRKNNLNNFINHEVEDLLQESLMKVASVLPKHDEKKSKATTFACNCLNNYYKDLEKAARRKGRPVLCFGEEEDHNFEKYWSDNPIERLEFKIFLEQTLNEFEIFILKARLEEYQWKEIVVILNDILELDCKVWELQKCFTRIIQKLKSQEPSLRM